MMFPIVLYLPILLENFEHGYLLVLIIHYFISVQCWAICSSNQNNSDLSTTNEPGRMPCIANGWLSLITQYTGRHTKRSSGLYTSVIRVAMHIWTRRGLLMKLSKRSLSILKEINRTYCIENIWKRLIFMNITWWCQWMPFRKATKS